MEKSLHSICVVEFIFLGGRKGAFKYRFLFSQRFYVTFLFLLLLLCPETSTTTTNKIKAFIFMKREWVVGCHSELHGCESVYKNGDEFWA